MVLREDAVTIAVTNAGGYPGAHMLLSLMDAGEDFIALEPEADLPPALSGVHVVRTDLSDIAKLTRLFKARSIDEIIHFTGERLPKAQQSNPATHYEENTIATYNLVKAATAAGIRRIVFSSTASVYGVPDRMPIREETPLDPVTPFGSSMSMAERMVRDIAEANGIGAAVLRYFNLAGADPDGRAGEEGGPRHLIKIAAQIAVGTRREKLQIYGDDYPTPDGTCIRDYVHVSDMAEAHLSALDHLRHGGASVTLNCGYGFGASVLDVISAVEQVTGETLPSEIVSRREGDPPLLIADNAEIRAVLDWVPRYDDLEYIVRSAIKWESVVKQRDVA